MNEADLRSVDADDPPGRAPTEDDRPAANGPYARARYWPSVAVLRAYVLERCEAHGLGVQDLGELDFHCITGAPEKREGVE